MKRSDEELRAGCDAIQGDMAKHQRMFKGEVTATENQQLAARTFEELEQQWAEEEANPFHTTPGEAQPREKEFIRTADGQKLEDAVDKLVTIEDRVYRISKAPDDLKFRRANEQEQWFISRAWPRIDLLLTKEELGSYGNGMVGRLPVSRYSWRDRVLIACRWQQIDRKRFLCELVQVLDDSNHHFGDWTADPERKVIVG